MLMWRCAIPAEQLDALPIGNDDHPVYAELDGGSCYRIDHGPWVKGHQHFVLTLDHHRVGRAYYGSVRAAQRAAVEHMLSHGLRPSSGAGHTQVG